MPKPTIAIVGGGIAGLSLAYHLQQSNHSYVLFEKEERVGGINRSEIIAGCVFDYAPRLFLLKNEYATELTQKLLGENIHFLPFGDWSYHRRFDVYTRLPFQKHMYGLPLHAILRGIGGYMLTMLPFSNGKEPANYQEWLYHELGKPIADMLIIPQEAKKWKTETAAMDHRWAPARVPRPDLKTLIKGAFQNTKHERDFGYTIRGGIEALMKAFLNHIDTAQVHTNKILQQVDTAAHTLHFTDGSTSEYGQLVSTMPLPTFIKLISDVPTEIKHAANSLTWLSLKAGCLVVNRAKISDKNFIYVHDPEFIFHRVSVLSNISTEIAPEGVSSLVVEVTYKDEPPMDDTALLARIRQDLIEMKLLTDDDEILGQQMLHLPMAYPMPSPDRISTVETIREYLATQDIHLLGRFGEWEYVNMHDIIPRARDLAGRLDSVNERDS